MGLGIQGIFNTAVQGMNSQSHQMSTISTNISNVNTTGYKAQVTHFQTLLNHVDPLKRSFFAVDTVDTRQVDKQGALLSTNRTFDVALNGRGFFVTSQSPFSVFGTSSYDQFSYTRDGAFFGEARNMLPDANGNVPDTDGNGVPDEETLLVTANGSYVYGWALDESGNPLPDRPGAPSLRPISIYNNSVVPARMTSNIDLQANLSASLDGRKHVGLPFVDRNGVSRTLDVGFTPVGEGEFTVPADSGRADAGQTIRTFNWTLDMHSIAADLSNVDVEFTNAPDDGEPVVLQFDGNGNLLGPWNKQVSVTILDQFANPNGGDPLNQTLTLDLRDVTQLADAGQLTVQNIEQDGYLEGTLDKTYFNNTGTLIGSYSNGQTRELYKLAVARFPAENNLEARPGNMFQQTAQSGAVTLTQLEGGYGSRTELIVGALESSNVDLADQFSKMIITQRAYSSSATVLRTADEMTMAARDLKR